MVEEKVAKLSELLRQFAGSCVCHVGAGLSTSAGIRDFRGKGGVWSELLEARKPTTSSTEANCDTQDDRKPSRKCEMKPFDQTTPTAGHFALKALCEAGLVRHIVSQNVDGLFLKANLERKFISELHGNFYLDECTKCRSRFIRSTASQSMRLQRTDIRCLRNNNNRQQVIKDEVKRPPESAANKLVCNGFMRDTILDWESPVPYNELRVAERESKLCKLHICIGTSLQLRPSRDLVCKPSTRGTSKLVVINLQPTYLDQRADLVINFYSDHVLLSLLKNLNLPSDLYDSSKDPTKRVDCIGREWRK